MLPNQRALVASPVGPDQMMQPEATQLGFHPGRQADVAGHGHALDAAVVFTALRVHKVC